MHKLIYFLFILLFTTQKTIAIVTQSQIDSASTKANNYIKLLQEYYAKGDYDMHKAYSDSLYIISSKNNLTKMEILALNNQAIFYKNRSEQKKAITLYHKALDKCKLIPDDYKTNIIVLLNLGNIYDNIGLPEKAIYHMEQVLSLTDTISDAQPVRSAAYLGLSNNYSNIKDYNKAIEYAYKTKALGEELKNESIIATALGNISDAYYQLNNYKKALEIGEEALNIPYIKNITKQRASILLTTGLANSKLNNIDDAINYLTEAKQIAIDKSILEIEMYAHKYLAEIHETKGDIKASLEAQKQYSKIRDLYTKEAANAGKLDLKNDLSIKDDEIIEKEVILDTNKKYIIGVSILCLILLSFLIFYLKRKKTIEKEKLTLRKEYQNLKNIIAKTEKEALFTVKSKPYKNSSIKPEDYDHYKTLIINLMDSEKPFLDTELKQSDLAKKLDLTSHHLSEILNYCFNQNFYNFINSYRIIEAQNLIKNNIESDTKIIAIAFDAGFKSKSSFNRVFKNYTGQTPTAYKNNLKTELLALK